MSVCYDYVTTYIVEPYTQPHRLMQLTNQKKKKKTQLPKHNRLIKGPTCIKNGTLHLLFGPTYSLWTHLRPHRNFLKYNWKSGIFARLETRGIIMSDFIYLLKFFLGGGPDFFTFIATFRLQQLDFTWAWWFLDANAIRGFQDSSKIPPSQSAPQCFPCIH
jgi:hypothetical protein